LIVEQIIRAVNAGRKLLVLSERVKHLQVMDAMFHDMWPRQYGGVPSTDYYVGGRKKGELEIAREARVIFATSQYAQEGLDIPALDTLFLTTPLSDVEQAVGRILRPFEGKKEPIVVDIRDDNVAVCERGGKSRDRYYSRVT
jgi:superfamily II DNA or RNA helicase